MTIGAPIAGILMLATLLIYCIYSVLPRNKVTFAETEEIPVSRKSILDKVLGDWEIAETGTERTKDKNGIAVIANGERQEYKTWKISFSDSIGEVMVCGFGGGEEFGKPNTFEDSMKKCLKQNLHKVINKYLKDISYKVSSVDIDIDDIYNMEAVYPTELTIDNIAKVPIIALDITTRTDSSILELNELLIKVLNGMEFEEEYSISIANNWSGVGDSQVTEMIFSGGRYAKIYDQNKRIGYRKCANCETTETIKEFGAEYGDKWKNAETLQEGDEL